MRSIGTLARAAISGATETSNFISSLIKTLPPLHEIAGMAGVELPSYLGRTAEVKKTSDEDGSDERPGGRPQHAASEEA